VKPLPKTVRRQFNGAKQHFGEAELGAAIGRQTRSNRHGCVRCPVAFKTLRIAVTLEYAAAISRWSRRPAWEDGSSLHLIPATVS